MVPSTFKEYPLVTISTSVIIDGKEGDIHDPTIYEIIYCRDKEKNLDIILHI